jgi:hypothetical protein
MAIKKTIEIDVSSQGAVSGIDNISNSIEQTDKATQSLRSQLRQAQADVAELSDKFGATSKEAIEAAKRAGELKDAIGDAKALTDAFNPDAKFSALSGSLSGVASGFSAVEGSLALAGIQSENLQETMVRLQAAMALSQGLQGLGESIDSFKQLGAVIKTTTIFQKASAVAQKVWNAAMASNPIGVIVVAVLALITAGYALIKMFNDSSEANEKAAAATKANTLALQNQSKQAEKSISKLSEYNKYQYDMAKASGASSEQLRKLALKHKDEEIALNQKNTMLARSTFLRERDTLAMLKNSDASDDVIAAQEKLTQDTYKEFNKQREGYYKSKEEKVALIRQQNVELKTEQSNANKTASDKQKQANEKAKADAQKAKEDKIKAEKDKADALERIRQGEIDTEKERRAEELRQVQEQYKQLIAEAEKYYGENSAKVLSLKEAQRTKEKELTDKFAAEDAEKKLAEDEKAKAEAQKKLDDEKAIADEKIKIEQAVNDAKISLQNQALDTASAGIGLLKGLFEKNKGLQKAALIAESAIGISKIIINTQAANAAAKLKYALLPGGAALSAVEIGLNKVSAGIGIAANIAATAKGLAALGGGGAASGGSVGGSSGGGASAPAPTPQFNVVGNSGINQVAATLGQQQPVQAFVVANQVTSQQALDRSIVNNASLG